MANRGKGALVGTLLVLGLIGYACGRDDDPSSSSSAPLTVASVETFADLTLSDGQRVHNTSVDNVASLVIPYNGASADYQAQMACTTQTLNRFAIENLVGRPVSRVEPGTSSYSTVAPMPGYTPAALRFVDGSSQYYDMSSAFNQVRSNAATACYTPSYSAPQTTTPAPTTTTEAPAVEYTDPDVYADAPEVDTPKRRSGQSGHPCLSGERDGDGDGYCGEGR